MNIDDRSSRFHPGPSCLQLTQGGSKVTPQLSPGRDFDRPRGTSSKPDAWVGYGFTTEPDYQRRLDIICETAGCTRAELLLALRAHLACERDRITTWGPQGTHPFDSFLERGFVGEIDAMTTWLEMRPI